MSPDDNTESPRPDYAVPVRSVIVLVIIAVKPILTALIITTITIHPPPPPPPPPRSVVVQGACCVVRPCLPMCMTRSRSLLSRCLASSAVVLSDGSSFE
jgi:hypothetical protein